MYKVIYKVMVRTYRSSCYKPRAFEPINLFLLHRMQHWKALQYNHVLTLTSSSTVDLLYSFCSHPIHYRQQNLPDNVEIRLYCSGGKS